MDLDHPRTGLRSAYTVPTTVSGSSATREPLHDFEPTSPLLLAISLGHLPTAQLLLRHGAELDKRDAHGKTALHLAVQRGDVAMAKRLLELGADILTADAHGSRLLHTAVENDNMEMVKLVLWWCEKVQSSRGNSLNASPMSTNTTAAGGGLGREKNREEANVVLRCINAQDGRKMTAVHLCVILRRLEILEILLDHGADVNIDCT
jgi:ankyrin repeat protein